MSLPYRLGAAAWTLAFAVALTASGGQWVEQWKPAIEVARFSANGYDPWSPIALAPDGKWVYTACSFTCEKKPVHAVYRVRLDYEASASCPVS